MPPLRNYILALLFLVFFVAHRSFALDSDQNATPRDGHFLTIQEYLQCLMAVASAEDSHELYNPETMSGEIHRATAPDDQQPHFLYGIAHGVDPQSPMHGLTELDAMRFCNWIENLLPSNDTITASTEVGSYLLHEDGSFEVNDQAQLHLLSHDDGTFEIVSKIVTRSTSPLMMLSSDKKNTDIRKSNSYQNLSDSENDDPDVNNHNYQQQLLSSPSSSSSQNTSLLIHNNNNNLSYMNNVIASNHVYFAPQLASVSVPSLASIIHDNNFDHSSIIGHTTGSHTNGSYVALRDDIKCLPKIIKNSLPNVIRAFFIPPEMKEQITFARKQIRADLEAAMKTSPRYQMSARNNKSGNSSSSTPAADTSQLNQSLINEHLAAFDQFFTEHQFCFTKEKLREFCTTHNFEVPIPALSLSPRRRLSTATEDSIGEQLQSATKRVKSFLNEKSSQLLASTPALVNKLDEANNYFNNQIFTQERINTALESGKKTIEVMDAPLKKIQEQLLTPERQEHLTLAAANAAAIGNQITDSVMKQLSDMSEQAISNGRQAVKNTTQFISPLKNSKSMEGIELMSTPQKAPSSSSSSSSSLSSSSEITSLLSNNDNDHDYQSLSHSSSSALDKNVQINNNIDATDQYFQWWL